MWETEFSEQLLVPDCLVVILCATRELEREMAQILDCLGCRYHNGLMVSSRDHWHEYGEHFCYFVNDKCVQRGSKEAAESSFRRYTKCTFQGSNSSDFDTASDQELLSLLGI